MRGDDGDHGPDRADQAGPGAHRPNRGRPGGSEPHCDSLGEPAGETAHFDSDLGGVGADRTAADRADGAAAERRQTLMAAIERHEDALLRGAVGARSHPLLDSGLTMQQFRVLLLVAFDGGLAGRELAARLGVSLATATGLVDRLVDRGLIHRVEDVHDRRVRRSSLSRAGEALLDEIAVAGREHRLALLARLDLDELRALERGLQALRTAADRMRAQ